MLSKEDILEYYDSVEDWEKAMAIHKELVKISASWNVDNKDNYKDWK